MYLPATFRQDDLAELHRQIAACRLAILVSQAPDGPQASHLPLLLVEEEGEFGTLYGHLARANPQHRLLDASENLAIFSGPDAYVSPSWYPGKAEHGKAVPTWNYIAVHAYGQARTFDDPARMRWLLERLTQRHEAGQAQPWGLEDAPADYLAAQLRACVGFALPIRRLRGKWKLSQNRNRADQAGVRNALSASANPGDRALAARMPSPPGGTVMKPLHIRPLAADQHTAWLALWRDYQAFYRADIAEATSQLTWHRLLDPAEPMHGALAWHGERAVALVHWIFHRSCWTEGDYCYLQDLFVAADQRGGGIGRRMIEHVYAEARSAGASRVHWLTQETNYQGRQLYDRIAERSGFIQYRKPL